MLNAYIRFSPQYDFLIKLIVALVFTCSLGPLVITAQGILPITLQTFFILFFSVAFGWQIGGMNTLLYILLGLAGLPIFPGYHGGIEQFNPMAIGFYFGFLAASLIVGFMAESDFAKKPLVHIFNWIFGHIIILALGGFWLRKFRPDDWWEAIEATLPGGLVKSAFGFLIMQLLLRFFMGRKEFYNIETKK